MPPPAQDPSPRAVRRVLWITLALNLAVAAAKLAVGVLVRSISMVADGFHSLTDSASNVAGLVGISAAARPPDEDHPYGHRRFETLAALLIGGLLALTAWEVFKSALERLTTGTTPQATPLSFVVMGTTMAVNWAVSTYERRRGETLGSQLLLADATHTRSDIYTSFAVLASLGATRAGFPQLDLLAALVITAFIGRAAFGILRENAMVLADAAVLPREEVARVAQAVPGVESVHKIRTRGHPRAAHADLHVQVRADLRLDQAHVIGHMVSDRLRRELGIRDVVVHVEPPEGHHTDWQPAGHGSRGPGDDGASDA